MEVVLALLAGLLIGTSAVLLMGGSGRSLDVGSMVFRSFDRTQHEPLPRLLFFLGLMTSAFMTRITSEFSAPAQVGLATSVISGFLIGFGATWARGCTTAYALVGLARGKLRGLVGGSLIALSAVVTVYLSKLLA
jgi:uncharacterized membrane protein YedE/YeeE